MHADFTECWILDGDQPILSPKHVARTILRYFKGHGNSYQFDEATWAYYRREKLSPVTLFQASTLFQVPSPDNFPTHCHASWLPKHPSVHQRLSSAASFPSVLLPSAAACWRSAGPARCAR